MKIIKPIRTFYLPSGRVILSETNDGYKIESTEMRDVSIDGKQHHEVRETLDPRIIWKHLVDVSEKWLLTVSTQKGCLHNCQFCDVAPLQFKGNLTASEIFEQLYMLIRNTPEIMESGTSKAKCGFARMGEPAHNIDNVLTVMKVLRGGYTAEVLDVDFVEYLERNLNKLNVVCQNKIKWLPCFNTILPRNTMCGDSGFDVINKVLDVKENYFNGYLHFQISCNSTDETKRKELFGGANVLSIKEIIEYINKYPSITNRTVTLNFIVMKDVPIDVKYLMDLGLNPEKFAVKLIPMNKTDNASNNNLETLYNYSTYDELKKLAQEFKKYNIPVVYDAIARCEEAGLCCGQLAHNIEENVC